MAPDSYVVGKCEEMCPAEEQKMRKREGLVHPLEKGKHMVKCFTRSAAGIKMANPLLIRTPQVLSSTANYLFNNIVCEENYKFIIIYEFIEDRIKSIKQDLFIQQIHGEQCITILEPLIRFYIYSAYRLGAEQKNFDSTLNHNQLLESLKWLLTEYDLIDYMSESRVEMESFYVLLNLGDPEALMRSLTLKPAVRQKLIQKCERLSLSWYLDNFIRIFKECHELPVLHSAILFTFQLPYIRRFALNVYNSAYSSKQLTVPLSVLQQQLLFNNEQELINECNILGIDVTDSEHKSVRFSKLNWKPCNTAPKFLQNDKINERINLTSVSDLILSSELIA
ncbi:hypothetical protein O3M35_000522 [Rhynocoris fuscipes]|uniref:SAC3/GANP/THP3 conserved domain-containing protein n=1 Tax=Rhynocoris fuscipes TaxID=488301 RepID=A0AAW1DLU3_9HEMI